MKNHLILTALATGLALGAAPAQAVTLDEMAGKLVAEGFTVADTEQENGVIEIDARRGSEHREVQLLVATGEIVSDETKYGQDSQLDADDNSSGHGDDEQGFDDDFDGD